MNNTLNKLYYLSLGENCLADDILKRYGLKSFSTPYSPARTNIEYAIFNEKNGYQNLLSESKLKRCHRYGQEMIVNEDYPQPLNIYDKSVSSGFEFTHHNILQDNKAMESFVRKVERMKQLKNQQVCFLYHYRYSSKNSIDDLILKGNEFLGYYPKAKLCIMTQKICKSKDERILNIQHPAKNITVFEFVTMNVWGGDDQNIFWARCDDDLISEMISHLQNIFQEPNLINRIKHWLFSRN